MKIGFDNDKYIEMQASHIRERIDQFGGKLYLEFGGKLFDDYHASRVLPGFAPDSKARMLHQLADDAEVLFALSEALDDATRGLWQWLRPLVVDIAAIAVERLVRERRQLTPENIEYECDQAFAEVMRGWERDEQEMER